MNIGNIVSSQIKSNMQSHMNKNDSTSRMVEYHELTEEEKHNIEVLHDFKNHFIDNIGFYLFKKYGKMTYPGPREIDYDRMIEYISQRENSIVEYMVKVNEYFLNSKDFPSMIADGNQEKYFKHLGNSGYTYYTSVLGYDKYTGEGKARISMSYVPALSEEDSNIIRLKIEEVKERGTKYNIGNIDICSNGELRIGKFYEVSANLKPNGAVFEAKRDKNGQIISDKRISQISLDSIRIDMQALEKIRKYIMHLYEIADLQTRSNDVGR